MNLDTNDNEDLLGNYLNEDPKNINEQRLQIAAKAFGVPLEEVRNIAKGMTNAREEVRRQEKE